MKWLKFVMSAVGNSRSISEDEVRVKGFLIQEVKKHPNMWGMKYSGVPGRSLSEEWEAILSNLREAFKNYPELLAKYKVNTVPGLKKTWMSLRISHRRKWSREMENDSTGKLDAICNCTI